MVKTVEGLLKDNGNRNCERNRKSAGKQPFRDGYQAELERSNELIPKLAASVALSAVDWDTGVLTS